MPVVQVTMIGNKTDEQKRRVLADLTRVVADDLDVTFAAVPVCLGEVPASTWTSAGLPMSEVLRS